MERREAIAIANRAYNKATDSNEDLVQRYYDEPEVDHGDSIARFIALEINDVHDETVAEPRQIKEIVRVLDRAAEELREVSRTFENEAYLRELQATPGGRRLLELRKEENLRQREQDQELLRREQG
jgi:hypothetical protein